MTPNETLVSKYKISLFFVGILLLTFPVQTLFAAGNIQVNLTDETVENQATTTKMDLEVFSGSVSSIGDSSVNVDSFTFSFNERPGVVSSPEDSIDTIIFSFEGSVRDTSGVDGSGSYTMDVDEGFPANSSPSDFSVNLIMTKNPENDAQFDVHLENVRYREDPGGSEEKILNESEPFDGSPTNVITVKALIETYDEVDVSGEDLPGVLAAESGDIPLIHMEFAGQNSSSNPVLGFSNVEFLLRVIAGNIVPGSPFGATDYGDFNNIKLIRSDQEEFGVGNQETLKTVGDLPGFVSPVYPMKIGSILDEQDRFAETTERSHYFVTISTNQGWGVEPDGDPRTQYFGYGDAWDALIDTGDIGIKYGTTSDSVGNQELGDTIVPIGPDYGGGLPSVFYHSIFPPLSYSDENIDRYFGQPTLRQNDGVGLDFFPDLMFGIVALGPSDTGTINTKLEEITITFPETSEDFTPRTDLRDLTATKFSGLAVWHNASGFGTVSHGDDKLLPLSPPDEGVGPTSSWVSDTIVRLRLQDGFELPSPSEAISGPDEHLEKNRGMLPGSINETLYLTALVDRTGNYPDTFTASIRTQRLEFTDGRGVEPPGGLSFESEWEVQPVSVFFEQFPEESGTNQIGAPSGPTSVIGLNTLDYADGGGTEARLDRIDVLFENNGDSFTLTDLNPLANADTSGVSLWKDNSSHSRNKEGVFQPNIDQRIPLRLHPDRDCEDFPNLYSCKGAPRGDYQEGFRVLLRVDHTDTTVSATVPAHDSDTFAGSDFFIVVNTSSQADNSNAFRATIGNPEIQDGSIPRISFLPEGAFPNPTVPSDHFVSIFGSGDNFATNRFYSQEFVVNTITSLEIDDSLLPSNAQISAGGKPKGLLGISASDGSEGDQTLEQITVTFESVTNFDTEDLRPLRTDHRSGVLLYRDDGDGVFSPATDDVVPLSNPSWETFSETGTVDLIPNEGLEVPDSSGINDFYIAVRASDSIGLGNQFRAAIKGGDIEFSMEKSGNNIAGTTPIVTASLPILVNDRTTSPYEKIKNPGERFDVLGINAADTGSKNEEYLNSVRINFEDVHQSNFQRTDFMKLSADTGSGVGLWRDLDDNGSFDPEEDGFLIPDKTPGFNSGNEVLLEFSENEQDTSIPDSLDNQDDFFVVIRPSASMNHGDDFEAEIPSEGVQTTNYSNGSGGRTQTIVRGSANIASLTFTDTDLMNDQVSATVQADHQDTVEIRRGVDEDVQELSLSEYERIGWREPDQPGGNQFTFDDLSVPVSADTIGLVARGFNDTGATNFSAPELFHRRDLAGINLEDRENMDLADALAADEDFGVVVFGNKGGSNSNPSDPAFDPSSGESLKVIPPETGTVTMEVFDINQNMIFRDRTGVPGETLEWKGRGMDIGGYVNNGAYIVKVKSGTEEKTFPVMVVK